MKRPPEPSSARQSTFDFSPPQKPQDRPHEELERRLQSLVQASRTGHVLTGVVLTNNRRRILSTQPEPRRPKKIRLRIHKSFLSADDDLLSLVVEFALGQLRGNRRQLAVAAFREHFERWGPAEAPSPPLRRMPSLQPKGAHFALEEIRDRIIATYFADEISLAATPPSITWGQRPPAKRQRLRRPRRRTLRLGSYDAERHLIRIHPVLDHRKVPLMVVESIVHHELLHAVIPIEKPSPPAANRPRARAPRRRVHTPEFRRRERLFAHHEAAEAWLAKNFDGLLRRRYRSR